MATGLAASVNRLDSSKKAAFDDEQRAFCNTEKETDRRVLCLTIAELESYRLKEKQEKVDGVLTMYIIINGHNRLVFNGHEALDLNDQQHSLQTLDKYISALRQLRLLGKNYFVLGSLDMQKKFSTLPYVDVQLFIHEYIFTVALSSPLSGASQSDFLFWHGGYFYTIGHHGRGTDALPAFQYLDSTGGFDPTRSLTVQSPMSYDGDGDSALSLADRRFFIQEYLPHASLGLQTEIINWLTAH